MFQMHITEFDQLYILKIEIKMNCVVHAAEVRVCQ